MRRRDAIDVIESRLPELRQRSALRQLSVFGSVARDEATDASDIDILVELEGPTTFDGYFGLEERLEREAVRVP